MINFLCDGSSSASTIVIYVVLIVVLIAMLVMPMFSQRKRNKEFMNMINSIRVGDIVKTAGGVIGKVTKILDKGEIKTVIIETGSKSEKSYMEFDMSMIYCVLKSTKVEESEDNADEPEIVKVDETAPTEAVEAKIEETPAETQSVEEPTESSEVEEKSDDAEKQTAKKTTKTTKRTTKKSTTKSSK